MNRDLQTKLNQYAKARKKKRKWLTVIASLCAVVAVGTSYILINPADTAQQETFCGFEEHKEHGEECFEEIKTLICPLSEEGHIHSESCYESVLTCEKEETAGHQHSADCFALESVLTCENTDETHVHSDECYETQEVLVCTEPECEPHHHDESCYLQEKVLVCLMEEGEAHQHTDECYSVETELTCDISIHEHTLQCFSDPYADLEDFSVWERTLERVEFSDDWNADVLKIAQTQLGYCESSRNYEVQDDGITMKGYTRYGDWYGYPYGDWCAMFCSFCIRYAGVDKNVMPVDCSCNKWIDELSDESVDLYRDVVEYVPVPGDLVFFDTDSDVQSDHIGFVYELITNEDNEIEKLKTIEGNCGDAVQEVTYDYPNAMIVGYGIIPEKPSIETDGGVPDVQGSEETDETGTDAPFTLTAVLDDGIVISANGTADLFPFPTEELKLCVSEVDTGDLAESSEEGAETEIPLPEVETDQAETDSELKVFSVRRFNISIIHTDAQTGEQEEIEPNGMLTITISGLQDVSEAEVVEVHHYDESGEMEIIDASVSPDGTITLDTDHFSDYEVVLMATGNQISSASAFANLSNGGTYFLSNDLTINSTVNISQNTTLDLNGHKLTVGANPLFNVSGGSLTIIDTGTSNDTRTVIDGASPYGNAASYSNGTLTYYVTESVVTGPIVGATTEHLAKHTVSNAGMIIGNNAGRAIQVSGGTVNLNGGYICNFKAENGGAVSQTGGTVNVRGTVLAANTATNRGGAIYSSGWNTKLNIADGLISGNTAQWDGGGGVCIAEQCTLEQTGGNITNNYASHSSYEHGGGGVLLASGAIFNLRDGAVTGNKAMGGGGGIKTWQDWGNNSTGKIYIYGGHVSANNCIGAEGGGININAGGHMQIVPAADSKIYITNNIAGTGIYDATFQHWGGGGIFCANDSCTVYIENALITDNDAGGFGGGVAGCSTGRITSVGDNGAAIFDNGALGQHTSGSESTKSEDHAFAYESPVFMQNGYQDYYCALTSNLTGGMLGGGAELWQGSADGVPITSTSASDVLTAASVMGLTAHPTDGSKQAAESLARVFINGNQAPTHGGGILANGHLVLGSADSVDIYARLELNALKKLYDKEGLQIAPDDGAFQFVMVDENGFEICKGVNDASGNIIFDRRLAFTEAGTYHYRLYELADEAKHPDIQFDARQYELEITVTSQMDGHIPWMDNIASKKFSFSNVKVTLISGGSNTQLYNQNPGNDEVHGVPFNPTAGNPFENREIDISEIRNVSVRAEKRWSDGNSDGKPEVTVELYKDGIATGQTAVLRTNHWQHTWSDLDADASYSVVEQLVSGYSPSYSVSYENQTTSHVVGTNEAKLYVKSGSWFVPASSISVGSEYIIVNPDGDKILYTTSAHADGAFTSADVYSVSKDAAQDRFSASSIPEQGVYVGTSMTTAGWGGASYPRTVLKNKALESYLLAQSESGVNLKGCAAGQGGSAIELNNHHLQIRYEWEAGALRYIIWTGAQFDSASSLGNIEATTVTGTTKVVSITNTPMQSVSYNLDILKVDAADTNHVLPGAQFELRNSDSQPLKFSRESNGNYKYDANGTITVLQSSNTGRIYVTGLPAGSYSLVETHPPDGYLTAEPIPILFDNTLTSRTVTCTVENSEITYELPETGGSGIALIRMGELLLLLDFAAFLIRKGRRRERRPGHSL